MGVLKKRTFLQNECRLARGRIYQIVEESDWSESKEKEVVPAIQDLNNDKETKDFNKCMVAELLDFKIMVEETYGPGVFEKTVGEDIVDMVTLFELKNKVAVEEGNPNKVRNNFNIACAMDVLSRKRSFHDVLAGEKLGVKNSASESVMGKRLKLKAVPIRRG